MENLDPPPPPQIKDGKMVCFCPSCGFICDLGGMGFAVPFYFVQDCSCGQQQNAIGVTFHSPIEIILLILWVSYIQCLCTLI